MTVPPGPLDMFVSREAQKKLDQIDFAISKPKSHNSSQFIGLATRVYTVPQAQAAYQKVRQMYPSYDHILMAYKIDDHTGYQDDGEHSAGLNIHKRIMLNRGHNMAVFVVRNFGGIHIGAQRFDCINTVADNAIDALILEHPQDCTTNKRHLVPVDPEISIPSPVRNEEEDYRQPTSIQDRLAEMATENTEQSESSAS